MKILKAFMSNLKKCVVLTTVLNDYKIKHRTYYISDCTECYLERCTYKESDTERNDIHFNSFIRPPVGLLR